MQHLKMQYGHNNIRVPFQLMLVGFVVLAAFYPIAFGEYSRIDDHSIVSTVKGIEFKTLPQLFIPRMEGGAYYRPVLFLSYLLDKYLFNLDAGFMHIHNILLHVLNALLIFWLTWQLTEDHLQEKNFIPLLSSLIFGLHPITTEPVSWIGGRTDVLACTFILLSSNFIILLKKTGSHRYIAMTAIFMALGFLTKEVSLAFIPGAFLLFQSPLGPGFETASEQTSSKEALSEAFLQRYRSLFFFFFGFGAILLFFLLRNFAFQSNSGRITATITFLQSDVIRVGLIFLQALGFYVKKIIYPFPLNFAITEIDPLYEILGAPVIILCFYIVSKKSMTSALFMTGIFLIIPSFIIALGQIAWTSFAERYTYLPTAFIIAASVIFIDTLFKKFPSFSLPVKKEVLLVILLAGMAVVVFHRSIIWSDSLLFLKDAVKKNPDFYFIRGQYADELASRGDIKNARIQYTIANESNALRRRLKTGGKEFVHLQYWEMPDLGLADLLAREGKLQEAIAAYEEIIRESKGESMQALNNVVVLYDRLLDNAGDRVASGRIKKKLSYYSQKFFEKSEDPSTFYWLGRKFLMRGDNREALAYFKKAERKFKRDDELKLVTQKFISRLEGK